MNKVFLIGNLTRDPELTETSGGVSVCKFSIAVNRNYTGADGERKTDFFNCIAWRGLGENIARYVKKGQKIAVSGSMEQRSYEDRNGDKRTVYEVIAQDAEFLTQKQNTDESAPSDYVAPPKQQSFYDKKPALQTFDDDSSIPF